MKITNNLGLPTAFVKMAQDDYEYKDKQYSVTTLLKGIRETILLRRYHDVIEQDVSDMIWLLFGTAVHNILEHQGEGEHEIKEERLTIDIGDYVLSGKFDEYNFKDKNVIDYKTCSVWKIIYGDFSDWKQQLLIYAYMLQTLGFPIEKGEVVALMKDHSKSKAKYDKNYPQFPVKRIPFDFTEKDFAEIEAWIKAKFEEVARAENMADDELPLCSLEERYNSGDKFAVMKKNRKRAMRVLDSLKEAEEWMKGKGGDFIETRPGEDKKCLDYCSCNQYCNYYKEKYGGEKK